MSLSKNTKPLQFNVEALVNKYKEHKCRLCGEFFCCPDCRFTHERHKHDVNVDCSLCIYGFAVLKRARSPEMVRHVIDKHLLPISRCVFCERLISADAILNSEFINCTFTNFPVDEIDINWRKMPAELREDYLKPCYINRDKAEISKSNIAETRKVSADDFDSPIGGSQHQQIFEKGDFANSTPVLGTEQNAGSAALEVQIDQINSPSNKQHLNIIKLENNVHVVEDNVKIRKVQFDISPQPASTKSPTSFNFLIKKSSIKKNRIQVQGQTSELNIKTIDNSKLSQWQNMQTSDEGHSKSVMDKSIVEDKPEKVTVEVKPIKRDPNRSTISEIVDQTTSDDTEGSHWMTAFEELPEIDSKSSNSSNDIGDIIDSIHVQDTNAQIEPEIISLGSQKQENLTEDMGLASKSTWSEIWTKYKSKIVEFTRISLKRPRNEFEDNEEDESVLNESKRRRLNIRARRSIHYYIKPELKRDVKKINRGMQTSM